jgi:ribosomal protein L44E
MEVTESLGRVAGTSKKMLVLTCEHCQATRRLNASPDEWFYLDYLPTLACTECGKTSTNQSTPI